MFGDRVLKVIGERLLKSIRGSDVLARYGGEEFILVSPNTDLATGMMLAERLRASVEQEPFVLAKISSRVTLSVGVAGTESLPRASFEDLMQAADQALYAAKQGGRNRCHLWTGTAGR